MDGYMWLGISIGARMISEEGRILYALKLTGAIRDPGEPGRQQFTLLTRLCTARKAVTETRGDKLAWIAHLIGGKGIPACLYVSAEAKAEATKQRVETKAKRDHPDTTVSAGPSFKKHKSQLEADQAVLKGFRTNEMPYSPAEKDLFQRQSLRAIVSGGLPLRAFEEPEMKILFGMMRTTAPGVMPTGKVVGGRLLNAAASDVEMKITKTKKNKNVGLSTNGWKAKSKDSINAICANVDFKSYLIELVEVTAPNKDGPSLCVQFAGMIDRVEFQLILGDYFKVNDMAAGIAEEAIALIGWINNHGKAIISQDRVGRIIVLAYLVANITRWTTHFIAFLRLFTLRQALQLAVLQKRAAIIAAEVGAAKFKEADRMEEEAVKFCPLIEDTNFWNRLETVLGDLEPIFWGKNINQKDSTRLDQVLLTIAGNFLRFADHPEPEVKKDMLILSPRSF
ncbi:hypothetical protein B0H17DRAFT_1127581 [Mycena rosella]|uniref:Uncharacterized protein n=1 Tax=Mycena rosella TaxID=1033263 RepID=A0AAD7E0X9_MYCRO|nr:hypothetical protein B0H17DRAFT_1127581 [Mycena rosella]